jgi:alkanesulfonate monooxygenase SsuD/methylene tetrahydromethanopterin reductase-like flavin-dependent oxidoreductase (luciferase family)
VTFKGRFHNLDQVNIVPPPVQRPIPVWFGGSSDAVLKRCARIGDGWMPIMAPDAAGEEKLGILRGHLRDFGRDAATFGLEGWLRSYEHDEEAWGRGVEGWRRLGAQMVMLYPMFRLPTFEQQIAVLERFKAVAGG